MRKNTLCLIVGAMLVCAGFAPARAADDGSAGDRAALERRFQKLLTGAVLEGSFTIDGRDSDGRLHKEKYSIRSVRKLPGGLWLFNVRIQYGGRDVTLPLPLPVKWAGDTPMISVSNIPIPGLGTYSARVLFHGNRYAGTWQGKGHGGQLFGSVVKAAAAATSSEEGFKPLFNGTDLTGWDGNPKFWSVKDGVVTGQTTPDNPTRGNTFLIWRQGDVDDFELRLSYRIVNGNSGIQYRSHDRGNWVAGGYQGDFEAGDTYSGILYEERGRGVLGQRGQKVVIGADGEKRVVGSVGDSDEIQAAIKKEQWNDYRIIARGHHFIHEINGHVTVDVTDEQVGKRMRSGILALQLHAGPPMTVQFKNVRLKRFRLGDKKKIVLIAGKPSHGHGAHEHNAGCQLLAKKLEEANVGVLATVYRNGWPADPTALDNADAVVMFCDGGRGHYVNRHLDEVDKVMKKGVGLACIHYGVEVEKGKSGDAFLDWIGGYFEAHWSVNPHWTAHFKKLPKHPITQGVRPFAVNDEWYYHMRFRKDMKGVTPILSDLPGKETLRRGDGAHSGNPHVRAAVARGETQHVAWASERDGAGRGFGLTGGHNHWNWGNDDFRKLALNAVVWVAHGEVPTGGVVSKPLSVDDLLANQDAPTPKNFNRERIQKMLDGWNGKTGE